MARASNYYHPVVNLISDEEKKVIKDSWVDNNLQEYFTTEMIEEYLKEYGSPKELDLASKLHYSKHYNFHSQFTNKKLYEKINFELLETIRKRYNADYFEFIYNKDDTVFFEPHKDGKWNRLCCVNIPIFPDYTEYRSTLYFEDSNPDKEPIYKVDYKRLKTPVLINVRKWHGTGNWHTNTSSLGLQLCYRNDYSMVKSMLSTKNLLTAFT